jgi:hypothetical protein
MGKLSFDELVSVLEDEVNESYHNATLPNLYLETQAEINAFDGFLESSNEYALEELSDKLTKEFGEKITAVQVGRGGRTVLPDIFWNGRSSDASWDCVFPYSYWTWEYDKSTNSYQRVLDRSLDTYNWMYRVYRIFRMTNQFVDTYCKGIGEMFADWWKDVKEDYIDEEEVGDDDEYFENEGEID